MQDLLQPNDSPLSQNKTRQAQASGATLQCLSENNAQSFQKDILRVSVEQPDSQSIERLQYKEREEDERHKGLDELVAEAQKLGMY